MHNSIILQCIKISKSYQEGALYTHVLHNINFIIRSGEIIVIIGTSGSGKSTLLHILGGLEKPTEGEVFFDGVCINKLSHSKSADLRNKKLGFIYQFHHLLSDFNALENVAMPLMIGGKKSSQAYNMAREMLVKVNLEKRIKYRPAELSGGERQRVAIARALVHNPILVLADEPTGCLDKQNTNIIMELLFTFNKYNNISFLIVTHDLQLTKKMHRKLEMCDGILYTID